MAAVLPARRSIRPRSNFAWQFTRAVTQWWPGSWVRQGRNDNRSRNLLICAHIRMLGEKRPTSCLKIGSRQRTRCSTGSPSRMRAWRQSRSYSATVRSAQAGSTAAMSREPRRLPEGWWPHTAWGAHRSSSRTLYPFKDSSLPAAIEEEVRQILDAQYQRPREMLEAESDQILALARDSMLHRSVRVENQNAAVLPDPGAASDG